MEFKLLSENNINAAAKMFKEGFKSNSPVVAYWTDTHQRALKKDTTERKLSGDELKSAEYSLKDDFFRAVMDSLQSEEKIDFFKYLLNVKTNTDQDGLSPRNYLIAKHHDLIFEGFDDVVKGFVGDKDVIKFILDTPEWFSDDEEYEKYFNFFSRNKELLTKEIIEDTAPFEQVYDFYVQGEEGFELSEIRIKGVLGLYGELVDDVEKKIFTAIFRQAFLFISINGDASIVKQYNQDLTTIKRLIPSTRKMSLERFGKWKNNILIEFKNSIHEQFNFTEEATKEILSIFDEANINH
ncbi:TPA: hypothetical protein R2K44_002427 [Raoultella ornithinolytica]|nr:hypothetical protein [Raoultella ornithinolytica]